MIKLEASKLLGFRIAAGAAGPKTGGKPGLKAGSKVGTKE
jgi:hypothetical protein